MGLDGGRTLNNSGTATQGLNAPLFLSNGSTFNNLSGAIFNLNNDNGILDLTSVASTFNNAGAFNRGATSGTASVSVVFNNTGTLNVNSGMLRLLASGANIHSGAFNVSAGATLDFGSGTHNLNSGASVTGAGIVSVSVGTVNFNAGSTYNVSGTGSSTVVSGGVANFTGTVTSVGPLKISQGTANFSSSTPTISVPALSLSGGSLRGTNTLTVSGPLSWLGGTMGGAGVTNANGGITISGAGSAVTLDTRTLNNAGTATWSGSNNISFFNGTLNNQSGAIFNVNNDQSMFDESGTETFNNAGTFNKAAGAVNLSTNVNVKFNNTGTVNATSGTLNFFRDYTQTTAGSATVLSGGSISITSVAPMNIQGGRLAGIGTITGNVSNTGGTVAPGFAPATPGILTIASPLSLQGNYTQGADGAFNVKIGGTQATQFDQLKLTNTLGGVATLGGTLNVTLITGFTPAAGNSFTILTCATRSCRTGTFTITNLPPLTGGLTWNVRYDPASVVLSVQAAAGPVVTLSSKSLDFANPPVGSTSNAQTVTLRNSTAEVPLNIVSIAATGDFAQTNNCGSSLAGSASCTITIVFTPTTAGTRSGAVTITDNAADTPQMVALTGAGINAPAISLSSTSLIFGSRLLATTSPPQTTTMTNTGNAALNIASIAAGGDFAQTNNCGTALAPGANCTISATFTPTAAGLRTGGVAIASDAPGSVPVVTLTGVGISSGVALSTTLVIFESQTVSTTSAPQAVTLTNATAATLAISSIVVSGDYAQTNTCGASVPASGSCTISVTFSPTAVGTRLGSVTITDSGTGSPRVITLRGTGSEITLSLSAASLTFGTQKVGTTSQPKTVTLMNTGGVTLTINGISLTGDYLRQSDSCGASLAAGAACTINVSFLPTGTGSRTGTITVTSNAKGSPHVVDLMGTGANNAPAVTLSPAGLTFTNQVVGTTSPVQTITVTSSGNEPLIISSIVASSDFLTPTNPCGPLPATLAPNATCVISVTFKPTAEGTGVGSVTLKDNAGDSPQQIVLIGTGVPVVSLSTTSVVFGDQVAGTSSAAQPVTMRNNGSASLAITSIAASGDFAQTNTCGASILAGGSCTINVTFNPLLTPPAVGLRTGAITIVDSGLGSPRTVALAGNGTNFRFAGPAVTSATIAPGGVATFEMTLMPEGGFNTSMTITCSGAPPGSACSVAPSSLILNAPTTIKTTFTTTAPTTAGSWPGPRNLPLRGVPRTIVWGPLWLPALAMLFGFMALRRRRAWLGAGACLLLVLLISGCAGGVGSPASVGKSAGPTPGTYTIMVTATTSGGASRSFPLTVTVRP